MTNGEKIQQDFECKVCEPIIEDNIIHVIFADKLHSAIGFDWDWWNAEYKGSTTKNDLGVDCVSRQEVDRLACRYLKEPTDDHVAFYEHFLDLPSVTPQNQYKTDLEKLERIKEIMSHEWSCWTPDYIQRVLDGTEDRY